MLYFADSDAVKQQYTGLTISISNTSSSGFLQTDAVQVEYRYVVLFNSTETFRFLRIEKQTSGYMTICEVKLIQRGNYQCVYD